MKVITREELEKHNSDGDVWMAIHGLVYDVSKFLPDHPGGAHLLQDVAGRDASGEFEDALHSEQARKEEAIVLKGVLEGCEKQVEKHKEAGWTEEQGIPDPETQEGGGYGSSRSIAAIVLLVGSLGAALAAVAFLKSRRK
ncbi:Cyt-b5 [Symbiodinium pilosum]|uniref:Cyt-b5 protein n=1 Tax=Symbiodinium pilosum TaxID=2952 RepID=A0A812JY30_SYMPI|nr:Cyt-b5 [Symbiodinium pilosum]